MAETPNQNQNGNEATEEVEEVPPFATVLQRAYDRFMKLKHIDAKTFGEHYFFPLIKKMFEEFDGAIAELEEDVDTIDPIDDVVTEALADSPEIVKEFSEYVLWTQAMYQHLFVKAGWLAVNPDDKTKVALTPTADDEVKESFNKIAAMGQRMANKIKELETIINEYEAETAVDDAEGLKTESPDAPPPVDLVPGMTSPAQPVTPAEPTILAGTVGTLSSSIDQPPQV